MLSRKIYAGFISCLCLSIGQPAYSTARNGELGASSSGHVLIKMNTEDLIKISNLSDIILVRNNNGDFVGGSDACVYRNATGTYTLRAYGSGGNGKFSITDGAANTLKYQATYNDGTGAQPLSPGIALTGRLNADTQSPRCSNGNNAAISVAIPAAEVDSKPAGNYIGGLTLIVSPQ